MSALFSLHCVTEFASWRRDIITELKGQEVPWKPHRCWVACKICPGNYCQNTSVFHRIVCLQQVAKVKNNLNNTIIEP